MYRVMGWCVPWWCNVTTLRLHYCHRVHHWPYTGYTTGPTPGLPLCPSLGHTGSATVPFTGSHRVHPWPTPGTPLTDTGVHLWPTPGTPLSTTVHHCRPRVHQIQQNSVKSKKFIEIQQNSLKSKKFIEFVSPLTPKLSTLTLRLVTIQSDFNN